MSTILRTDRPHVQAQAVASGLGRSGPLHVPPDGDHAQEDGSSADNRDCLCAFETHKHVTSQRPDALHPRPDHRCSAAVTTGTPPATPPMGHQRWNRNSPTGLHLVMSPRLTTLFEGRVLRGRIKPLMAAYGRATAIRSCRIERSHPDVRTAHESRTRTAFVGVKPHALKWNAVR